MDKKTTSISIYVSGTKQTAKDNASSQCASQGVVFSDAMAAFIDALPGDRVCISLSGSMYEYENGKKGSALTLSSTSDTMDLG